MSEVIACAMTQRWSLLQIDYWERDDQDTFPSKWVNVYKVTFGLSFVLVATYLVQVFVFWFWRKAFVEEQASHAGTSSTADVRMTVLVLYGYKM